MNLVESVLEQLNLDTRESVFSEKQRTRQGVALLGQARQRKAGIGEDLPITGTHGRDVTGDNLTFEDMPRVERMLSDEHSADLNQDTEIEPNI